MFYDCWLVVVKTGYDDVAVVCCGCRRLLWLLPLVLLLAAFAALVVVVVGCFSLTNNVSGVSSTNNHGISAWF